MSVVRDIVCWLHRTLTPVTSKPVLIYTRFPTVLAIQILTVELSLRTAPFLFSRELRFPWTCTCPTVQRQLCLLARSSDRMVSRWSVCAHSLHPIVIQSLAQAALPTGSPFFPASSRKGRWRTPRTTHCKSASKSAFRTDCNSKPLIHIASQ